MNLTKILNLIKVKRKYFYWLIGIIVVLLISRSIEIPPISLSEKGFADGISEQQVRGGIAVPTVAGTSSSGGTVTDQSIDRKVIKTASLELEVKDFLTEFNKLISLAEGHGGFISSSSAWVENKVKVGNLVIRVPADQFNSLISNIEQLGEVKSKQISGQDITEEFIDLQARLQNAKATEQRLLEILDKANNVEEILNVEAELNNIREKIEQLTGRIKYLQDAADLATISINIHEPRPIIEGDNWFINSLKQALQALANTIVKIIVFIGAIIPYIIIFIIGYIVYKIFKRK